MEVEQISKEVVPVSDQAKLIRVVDQVSLTKANDFFLVIREMKKKVASVFDPIIEAAKEAKRKADATRAEAVSQKEKIEAPLVAAESYLTGQIGAYKSEQDRLRREEEEFLRQEAIKAEMERRQREEAERMRQAEELEQAGATEEAKAVMEEVLEEVSRPVTVHVAPSTPKVELKGLTFKTLWSAEVTNLKALCRAIGEGKAPTKYVEANMTELNRLAVALNDSMNVPGVKAVSRQVPANTRARV